MLYRRAASVLTLGAVILLAARPVDIATDCNNIKQDSFKRIIGCLRCKLASVTEKINSF